MLCGILGIPAVPQGILFIPAAGGCIPGGAQDRFDHAMGDEAVAEQGSCSPAKAAATANVCLMEPARPSPV